MSEPTSPLEAVDPNSLTLLFRADPAVLPDAKFDALIAEFRRRADVAASEAARIAAEGEAKKRKPRSDKGKIVDAAIAALADKPVSELSLDDLGEDV